MSLKWIATELHIGRWTHVSKLLGQKKAKSVNNDRQVPGRRRIG